MQSRPSMRRGLRPWVGSTITAFWTSKDGRSTGIAGVLSVAVSYSRGTRGFSGLQVLGREDIRGTLGRFLTTYVYHAL